MGGKGSHRVRAGKGGARHDQQIGRSFHEQTIRCQQNPAHGLGSDDDGGGVTRLGAGLQMVGPDPADRVHQRGHPGMGAPPLCPYDEERTINHATIAAPPAAAPRTIRPGSGSAAAQTMPRTIHGASNPSLRHPVSSIGR